MLLFDNAEAMYGYDTQTHPYINHSRFLSTQN